MKSIGVYYNNKDNNTRIISEQAFMGKVQEKIEEMKKDTYFFNDWCADNYSPWEIIRMDGSEKNKVTEEFLSFCEVTAIEELEDEGWHQYLIED